MFKGYKNIYNRTYRTTAPVKRRVHDDNEINPVVQVLGKNENQAYRTFDGILTLFEKDN